MDLSVKIAIGILLAAGFFSLLIVVLLMIVKYINFLRKLFEGD